jgi:hypothetical protein
MYESEFTAEPPELAGRVDPVAWPPELDAL